MGVLPLELIFVADQHLFYILFVCTTLITAVLKLNSCNSTHRILGCIFDFVRTLSMLRSVHRNVFLNGFSLWKSLGDNC